MAPTAKVWPSPLGLFSVQDRQLLAQRLKLLTVSRGNAMFDGSPEADALLTIDPESVNDRAMGFVAATNLVSTLIAAGLLGPALAPFDVDAYEGKKVLTEIFNVLLVVLTVINVLQSLYTTYILMQLATTSSQALYRGLARGGRFVFYQVLTYVSGALICALANLAVWIRSSNRSARFTTLTSVLIFALMHQHIFATATDMFPWTMSRWSKAFAPWIMLNGRRKRDAQRVGSFMAQSAEGHLNDLLCPLMAGGFDDDNDDDDQQGTSSSSSQQQEPDLEDVVRFVADTLSTLPKSRIDVIAAAMLRNGLTLEALASAGAHHDGTTALFTALDLDDADLRRGDRLMLASAARNLILPAKKKPSSNQQRPD